MSSATWKAILLVGLTSLAGGLVLNGLVEGQVSLQGGLGAAVLLTTVAFLLRLFLQGTESPRWVGVAVGIAFLLRLLVGVGLSLALPVWGHESEVSRAGYLFFDAYTRDRQAWELARSGNSMLAAFGNENS